MTASLALRANSRDSMLPSMARLTITATLPLTFLPGRFRLSHLLHFYLTETSRRPGAPEATNVYSLWRKYMLYVLLGLLLAVPGAVLSTLLLLDRYNHHKSTEHGSKNS